MVSDSMPRTTAEWILFDEMCEQYAPKVVDSVSKLPYRGAKLREGSFLTLSSSIVWNSVERYDFVRKLGEYRSLDTSSYDFLVADGTYPMIPDIDWFTRLENATKGTAEYHLHAVYSRGGQTSYLETESIRYFERCVYEHIKSYYKDYKDVSDLLYKVFPEAPSALYKMLIDVFYHKKRGKHFFPGVIDFFWKDPHYFNQK